MCAGTAGRNRRALWRLQKASTVRAWSLLGALARCSTSGTAHGVWVGHVLLSKLETPLRTKLEGGVVREGLGRGTERHAWDMGRGTTAVGKLSRLHKLYR